LTDRPQVLEEWFERLAVPRRDVGTGMSDAEVDELSARIDLHAQTALLHPYGHYFEARVAAGLWGARSP